MSKTEQVLATDANIVIPLKVDPLRDFQGAHGTARRKVRKTRERQTS